MSYLFPSSGPVEGKRIKGKSSSAIYIGLDGALRIIPNPDVYKRLWGDAPWEERPQDQVDQLPKGLPLDEDCCLYEADALYFLYDKGRMRWIPNAGPDGSYGFLRSGSKLPRDIVLGDQVGQMDMGRWGGRRFEDEGRKIYLVMDNGLRYVPTIEMYNRLFVSKGDTVKIYQKYANNLRKGKDFPDNTKLIADESGKIYLLEYNRKRYIPEPSLFSKYDFDYSKIDRSDPVAHVLPDGPPIP